MEYEKLIKERYSVRSFKKEHLKKEEIVKILEAAHIAPTGCNNQPQRILVLNNDDSMAKLKNCTKCHFNAPAAMIVCYDEEESWKSPYDGALSAPVDAAIVTTHMMLAAYNIGVGSCWVMHFNPAKVKEEFNIPDNIKPLAILIMGYPRETSVPSDYHNKFRPLEEIVVYDKF